MFAIPVLYNSLVRYVIENNAVAMLVEYFVVEIFLLMLFVVL